MMSTVMAVSWVRVQSLEEPEGLLDTVRYY
jgi:hypothetical protein